MSEYCKLEICSKCQGSLNGGTPSPLVGFKITIQRMGLDVTRTQQYGGLATMFGGGAAGFALAGVMGIPEVVKPVGDKADIWICERCALEYPDIWDLFEIGESLDTEEPKEVVSE